MTKKTYEDTAIDVYQAAKKLGLSEQEARAYRQRVRTLGRRQETQKNGGTR